MLSRSKVFTHRAQQINGINSNTKSLLGSDLVNAQAQLGGLSSEEARRMDTHYDGRLRQFYKHLRDVESKNVSDVYEMFAVVSVLRRNDV